MYARPMFQVLLLAAAAFIAGCDGPGATTASATPFGPDAADSHAARVERGRYLVTAVGCADCHSPKIMSPQGPVEDPARMLSGHPEGSPLPTPPDANGPWIASTTWDLTAWSGPWGISYAQNLTPDENTGIGIWTEEMFMQAIRSGKHMGVSRQILPPMPWNVYRNFTDDDLRAIYAYLRTIPPIHNRVPDPVPPATASAAPQPPHAG